jgi:glucose-6-phosphate 1-dehydrogenase
VEAKVPGPELDLKTITMDVHYGEVFGREAPEAYERLLLDAIHGDPTLYARGDWVEQAWALLMPVLHAWRDGEPPKFPNYEAGTWGPAEADHFMERDGRKWRKP